MQKHFSDFFRGLFQEAERTKRATDDEDKCSSWYHDAQHHLYPLLTDRSGLSCFYAIWNSHFFANGFDP